MATWVLKIPDWLPVRRVSWKGYGSQMIADDRQTVLQLGLIVGVPTATGRRRVDLEIRNTCQHPADADRYFRAAVEVLVSAGFLVDTDDRHVERGDVTFASGQRATTIRLSDLPDQDLDQEMHQVLDQADEPAVEARPLPSWEYKPLRLGIPAGDDEDSQRSDCTTGNSQAKQEIGVDLVACAASVGQS